jgi:flagellar protein FlaI
VLRLGELKPEFKETSLYQLAASDLFFDRIREVSRREWEGYVYDLSLPGTESFVCNGILCHNTAELQLPHRHWVRLEYRPPNIEGRGEITLDDLVKNALRMRPDRIIVGEVRGPEALTLFTALNTGHDGCMGTLHANSAAETITRLTEPPMSVPPIMIPALDIIIMQQRIHHKEKGVVRRITEVAEVTGLEGGRPQLSRIYVWDARKDDLLPTNVPSRTLRIISEFSGMTLKELQQEMKRREKVLSWLLKKGIRDLKRVGETIQRYYLEPEKVLKEVD